MHKLRFPWVSCILAFFVTFLDIGTTYVILRFGGFEMNYINVFLYRYFRQLLDLSSFIQFLIITHIVLFVGVTCFEYLNILEINPINRFLRGIPYLLVIVVFGWAVLNNFMVMGVMHL
jgi:hypothetical protein